jgi:hypothetical protein
VVLLVHGWGGHAGQLLPLAESLAQQGLRPVLLEMPAHGRSGGSPATCRSSRAPSSTPSARLQQEGHALGAAGGAFAGRQRRRVRGQPRLAIGKLVLLAPPASPREYTRYFAQVFGLSERTRAAMQRRIEAREGVLMPQFEPRRSARASPCPRWWCTTAATHQRLRRWPGLRACDRRRAAAGHRRPGPPQDPQGREVLRAGRRVPGRCNG